MPTPHALLAETLRNHTDTIASLNVVSGFDGFVDELIEIVEERQSTEAHTRVPTISRFAELIGMAAGRSSLREMIVKSVDAGGCAVNLGDGIASLGVQLDVFGTLGEPAHPAFSALAAKCRSCNSFGIDPGHTLALEFEDGKYMLSSMNQLADFTPAFLKEYLKNDTLKKSCQQADLIAITNWTLYPHMTDCWAYLLENLFNTCTQNPWFFIDLVDPRSRTHQDIRDMLTVLPGYEACGRCSFGGNLNEGNVISQLLDLPEVTTEGPEVAELCSRLRDKLQLSEVVIHCIKGAAVASDDGSEWVDGPYTAKPKKSTGAGDRFNAGYCLGRLLNLPAKDRLLLGNATSGFFVRNARSGSLAEIAFLLDEWGNGNLA
jgi:hypothetical protein